MVKPNWRCPDQWSEWSEWLSADLHARNRWRLPVLLVGILFASGRRTVTSWLRAAGVSDDFDDYYYFLAVIGRKTKSIATQLVTLVLRTLPLPERLLLVIDDSPTKRYGPKVEGADIHHNPTPGPADQTYLYGHIWVTISLALRHPQWGAVGLPLRAMLYVRRKTMAKIPPWRQWRFATKLELAAKLVEWIVPLLKNAGKAVWIVIDGGYTKRPFLDRALKLSGVVVVGRLRKDAALRDLPPKLKPGKPRGRGRPRKYGKNKISLAKRAGQKRGWQTAECTLYGETVTKPSWPLTDRSAALSELCWSKKIMVGLRSSVLSRKPVRWKYWKPLPTVPRANRTSTTSRKSGDRANNRFETSGRTSPSTT